MQTTSIDELSVRDTLIDIYGNILPKNKTYSGLVHTYTNHEYLKSFFLTTCIPSIQDRSLLFPSIIYRTSFYQKAQNVFIGDAGPAGDQFIHFQTERLGGTIGVLEKPLYYYRIHQEQDSRSHMGFMNLQLIDYLLNDPYYVDKLRTLNHIPENSIWNTYLTILKSYCKGTINSNKFSAVFSYRCVNNLKKTFHGYTLLLCMKILYHFRGIVKTTYHLKKGL